MKDQAHLQTNIIIQSKMSNSIFIIKYSNSRSDDLDELVNTDSDDEYDINPIRSSIYFFIFSLAFP